MINVMNCKQVPEQNPSCKNCAYSEQYAKLINNDFKEDKVEIQGSLF